ncbi:MAG: DNA polymerase II large subunit [archaeon]
MSEIIAVPRIQDYFAKLNTRIKEQYKVAEKARMKGFDIETFVESKPAIDLADRTETLVGPKGVAKRYRELYKELKGNRMKIIAKITEEIIREEWIKIPDDSERVAQAIRTGLVILTEGVVVSPLDGLPEIKVAKNPDGSKYVDIYFAGPIRAAGGSATVLPLLLGDFVRKIMHLDKFKPTQDEIERYVEEVNLYQTEVVSRQINLTDKEIRLIVENCPVCINGTPTEEKEVSVYRDLERFPSNRIRGGMGLIVTEGVGLKALKVMKMAKNFDLDWSWLEKMVKIEKKQDARIELKPNFKYLDRLAAGRPLLSYPSKPGGFRARYGRARNTCAMGKAINPATMEILDEFIAVGTHIRIERPGKAAQLFPCTTIDGPIVLLENGSVERVNDLKRAEEILKKVKRILFLGDILMTLGDFRKSAHPLVPSAYVEEWWVLDLEKAVKEKELSLKEKESLQEIIENPRNVNGFQAVELSLRFGVPLHPKFLHYYGLLKKEELLFLIQEFLEAEKVFEKELIVGVKVSNNEKLKKLLEKIGCPHKLELNKIVIEKEYAYTLLKTLGCLSAENSLKLIEKQEDVCIIEMLTVASGMLIRDKCGTFIGARMGRPEAARERTMKGNPHVLFPIGLTGGNTRSINKSMDTVNKESLKLGKIKVEINYMKCMECGKVMENSYCRKCNNRTVKANYCKECQIEVKGEVCNKCGKKTFPSSEREINIQELMANASKNLNERIPGIVKGVKGLINQTNTPEPIEKGILRAKHNLHVFRDGTIRYELLNAPITHFKPIEINLSVEKIKQLGYTVDYNGKEITSENQLIEIFPQDAILHEGAGDCFLRVSKFVDDLLVKFYGLNSFYNAETKEDLIGQLIVGLAPHTSAGIIGRILGYSKAKLGWFHPYYIMVKRRNVDGDQDSAMLLLDCLINYSEKYLSSGNGGKMDAALACTTILNPTEVDDEIYEMEVVKKYPLEFYEKTLILASPFLKEVEVVQDRLDKENQFTDLNFTHETEIFDKGPKQSRYVQLKTMEEKIKRQAILQQKIDALEFKDSLERVLVSHFVPDIIGNARAFSRQNLRCTKCGEKYRRIPLKGKCTKCGNKLILTIAQGSVRKYLKIAKETIAKYELSDYLKQRIDLAEEEINSIFINDKSKQKALIDFM